MNILPHKSWHVRTKKNIARVRKDEAQAAEEEKERQRRIALAAQEARTGFLRERASQRFQDVAVEEVPALPLEKVVDIVQKDGHVNFFQDLEEGIKTKDKTNVEHEEEKRKEQEDYEKKIGYLTYLGQNSLEHSKERPWYATISRPSTATSTAEPDLPAVENKDDPDNLKSLKQSKLKDFHDPLKDIRKYLHTPGVKAISTKTVKKRSEDSAPGAVPKKRKRGRSRSSSRKSKKSKKKKSHKSPKHKRKSSKHHKKSSSSSSGSESDYSSDDSYEAKKRALAQLRAERMEREKEESKKAERLMAKMRGEVLEEDKPKEPPPSTGRKQKYSSQFNPHLARQNFDD